MKNNRKSILADRPLTIFKGVTKKDSRRFFSPAPTSTKNILIKAVDTEDHSKINKSARKKLNPMSLSKLVRKKKDSFKKIAFSFHKKNSKVN